MTHNNVPCVNSILINQHIRQMEEEDRLEEFKERLFNDWSEDDEKLDEAIQCAYENMTFEQFKGVVSQNPIAQDRAIAELQKAVDKELNEMIDEYVENYDPREEL